MVNWVAHGIWGSIPFYIVAGNLAVSVGLALLGSILGDVLSHYNRRRLPWHDPLIVATHVGVGYVALGAWGALAGLASGFIHLALDQIPYKLSFLVAALGLLFWYWALSL